MVGRLRACRAGSVAVETALILPVLLLMLLGIIEFGRLMWVNSSLQYAAEEGARYGLAHSTAASSEITALVQSRLTAVVNPAAVQVAVASSTASISVTLTYRFTFFSGDLLPYGPKTLTANSTIPRS